MSSFLSIVQAYTLPTDVRPSHVIFHVMCLSGSIVVVSRCISVNFALELSERWLKDCIVLSCCANVGIQKRSLRCFKKKETDKDFLKPHFVLHKTVGPSPDTLHVYKSEKQFLSFQWL